MGLYACSLEGPLPLGHCCPAPARGPGAPCRSPRAGFQGDHAVAWGPRSLHALPILPWNLAFLLAGLGSPRPGDIAAGSWELLGGTCRAEGAAVLKSVGHQGTF